MNQKIKLLSLPFEMMYGYSKVRTNFDLSHQWDDMKADDSLCDVTQVRKLSSNRSMKGKSTSLPFTV